MTKFTWMTSALAILLLLLPFPVPASDLAMQSVSYLVSRETADSEDHLLFYEYLGADIGSLGNPNLSFHAAGWGRIDLASESFGRRSNGELQHAYLEYAPGAANAAARLGRVVVNEGVAAAEQMDGLYLRTDLLKGFAAAAYFGIPTETDEDHEDDGLLYGGRISHGDYNLYEVGLSFLREENDGSFREEEGIDLYLRPLKQLEINGRSSYDSLGDGWMEHYYRLTGTPADKLRISGEVQWVDYENYFRSPMNPAFSFLPSDEEMTAIGTVMEYTFPYGLTLAVDYRRYNYDVAGDAEVLGLAVIYGAEWYDTGVSARRSTGEVDRLKYSQLRGWGSMKMGKFDFALDIQNVSFDQSVSGVKDAFAASGSIGFDFRETARLAAAVEYQENPFYEDDLRASLKFVYKFSGEFPAKGGQK